MHPRGCGFVMIDNKTAAKDAAKFQINRKITRLYKILLFLIDELEVGQFNIAFSLLKKYRSQILTEGNETQREIGKILDNLP